jgi:prohibitin 2
MRNKEPEVNLAKAITIIAIFILLIIALFASIRIVPAGHAGVKTRFGAVQEPFLDEGIHIVVPFVDGVKKMEVKTQKFSVSSGAASRDLQVVSASIVTNFRVDKSKTPNLYQTVGTAYTSRIIEPAVHEVLKSTTARFTAEELITKRALVKEEIENTMRERLQARGIIIEEISITDFDFSASFNNAIEEKVTAEQRKLKAERDLERIEIEAKQREAVAIGEMNAEVARAEGQAKAIAVIEQQLKQSPNYLEYYRLDKWDGVLPLVMGTDANPFINLN